MTALRCLLSAGGSSILGPSSPVVEVLRMGRTLSLERGESELETRRKTSCPAYPTDFGSFYVVALSATARIYT